MIPLGQLVGAGRSGDVYTFGAGKVIKLFHPHRDADHVHREFSHARAVSERGLPAPAVYEEINYDGRRGIVFEHAVGVQMEKAMMRHPLLIPCMAKRLARLHLALHRCKVPTLPWQIERYGEKIRASTQMPFALQRTVLDLLYRLPLGDAVCHGDLTPQNVVVTDSGEKVVDWLNATQGNPMACVAETSVSLLRRRPGLSLFFMGGAWLFRRLYLAEYFRESGPAQEQLAHWEVVVSAAMLQTADYPPERHRLRKRMQSLLETGSGR